MNLLTLQPRTAYLLCAATCAALLAYAFYEQFAANVEPCPLCILQRLGFIGLFLVSVAAAIHDPAMKARRIYGALALLCAGGGLAVAVRHVWVQHFPPPTAGCGAPLSYLLDSLPLAEALKKAFTGTAECSEVNWAFAGLSMPEWTLMIYAVMCFAAYWFGLRPLGPRSS